MRGSIQKKGSNYYAVLPIGPKRKWIAGGRKKAAAEKILGIELQRFQRAAYRDLKKINFRDFKKLWIETYAEGHIKASTLQRYEQLLNHHLVPYFGDYPLTAIKVDDVQRYLSYKLKEGKIAAGTINQSRVILSEMMKHACQWGYADANLVQPVRPLKTQHREMDFLNHEELQNLLSRLPAEDYAFFLFLSMTGCRLGEALAAKWGNLDWNRKQYFIKESFRKKKFTSPKSDTSRRAVDLTPKLIEALRTHRAVQNKLRLEAGDRWTDMDLIFPSECGTPRLRENIERRVFKAALKKAKIRTIRMHDLRHTNAALRIQAGQHPKYIQRQLGHASIKVTLDTYGHLMEAVNSEAAEKLEEIAFAKSANPNQEPEAGEIVAS